MDMPPSRYKVVEEGRRLVVIDRMTGERVRHQIHERPHRPDMPAALAPPRTEGRAPDAAPPPRPNGSGTVIATQSWYDRRAPRAVVLDDSGFTTLLVIGAALLAMALVAYVFFGFFALILLVFLAGQKHSRAALRRGVTDWLDGLEQI